MGASGTLLERSVAALVDEYLSGLRVVVLNGPRQAGKTTLMRQLIASGDGELRNLDDETQLAAARRDPVGFVASGRRPLYLDEVQRAGEPIIRAVKAAVDADPTVGQFFLAGSTRFLAEPTMVESLAGRAGVLEVLPFSQGELAGHRDGFLHLAFDAPTELRRLPPLATSRAEYIDLMVRGGFPEASRMTRPRVRRAWFANYISAITERDIREMARVNQSSAAATVLRGLAAMSAQMLLSTTLSARADLPRATVDRYTELLDAVFLIHRLQPWARNPLTQAVKHAKVYVVDSGLLCHLLGDSARTLNSPTARNVGPVAETFVVNELRKQASWSEVDVALYHYRDSHGNAEVDVVIEAADGRVIGLEVKAAQTVTGRDFKHLSRLNDKLGTDFVHGFVVYLGQHVLSFGANLTAIPLGALWT
ncbi:MAG: ATP-binding protein [Mycobacteriales bacterium]